MKYTTRPLSDRAWLRADSSRKSAPFRLTWPRIEQKLFDEVAALDGRDLIIGLDITESDLRIDGRPRANAHAATPAVEVAFESKHGPLLYRSDNYGDHWSGREGWHENAYAVALTLEALRSVDRWGAANSGEQYRGYQQIEAPPATSSITRLDAAETIALAAYPGHDLATSRPNAVNALLAGDGIATVIIRRARRYTHPDTGGSAAAFQAVQEAITALSLGGAR